MTKWTYLWEQNVIQQKDENSFNQKAIHEFLSILLKMNME